MFKIKEWLKIRKFHSKAVKKWAKKEGKKVLGVKRIKLDGGTKRHAWDENDNGNDVKMSAFYAHLLS